ncbi:MAG: DUF6512 family protein [Blautia sp.]
MQNLKRYILIGVFFVLITGTLSHFFYDWTNQNTLAGFFFPVNESVREHMKLIFFPMIVFSLAVCPKLKEEYPCIPSALAAGILLGTFLMPVVFYTYTGILGYHLLFLDILTFILCVIAAFYIVYKLTLSCKAEHYSSLLKALVILVCIYFILQTYL